MAANETALVAQADVLADVVNRVVMNNDLSGLTKEQQLQYVGELCRATGLRPIPPPFNLMKLDGKLQVYANKTCTDQLRALHNISVDVEVVRDGDVVRAKARAENGSGRKDTDFGTVSVKGLMGQSLANAELKAITKAKRRVTLSICGLGLLDETEVETIPNAEVVKLPVQVAAPAEAQTGGTSAVKPVVAEPVPQPVAQSPQSAVMQVQAPLAQKDYVDPSELAGSVTKQQKMRINELVTQLQQQGVDITQMRTAMKNLVGVESRQLLSQPQADEVIENFAQWIGELRVEQGDAI